MALLDIYGQRGAFIALLLRISVTYHNVIDVAEYCSFTVWISGHLLIHDLKLRCRGLSLTSHILKNYIICVLYF